MDLEDLTKLAKEKGFSNYGEAYQRFIQANPAKFPDSKTMEQWLNQH